METIVRRNRRLRAALVALLGLLGVGTHEALSGTAEDHLAVAIETKSEIETERRMLCIGIGSLLWLCVVHQVRL